MLQLYKEMLDSYKQTAYLAQPAPTDKLVRRMQKTDLRKSECFVRWM